MPFLSKVVSIPILAVACASGFASAEPPDSLPEPLVVRGTQAGMDGPNLMADSSFESIDSRVFSLDRPFRMVADTHAHSGKADVQATLSGSGKRMYSRISVWKNTDYVSSFWLRGSGGGSLFVATEDLAERLAAVRVTAAAMARGQARLEFWRTNARRYRLSG
jgi:hypothetical protein